MNKVLRVLLMSGFITGTTFGVGYWAKSVFAERKEKCEERISQIEKSVESALNRAEGEIYIVEGMQFSAGGGYFYLPKGMDRSEQERKEISARVKAKESIIYDLEKRIKCVFHPENEEGFYCLLERAGVR